jgi:pyruvyltransferase
LMWRVFNFIQYQFKRRTSKLRPQNLLQSFKTAFHSDAIFAWWYEPEIGNPVRNFGDALNPILIKFLSGQEPIQAKRTYNITNKPVYSVIGSILEVAKAKRLVVWGSGFMYANGHLRQRPEKVWAVRGPLSRQILLSAGIDCPEVYGDPSLLCPMLYQPDVKKTHKLGIVPHHFDKGNPIIEHLIVAPDVKLIDIESGVYNVIDEINSCEFIASSSLHGIIVADTYGIPSLWIKCSDKIGGGEFKFRDYLASVEREVEGPLVITERTTLAELFSSFQRYEIHIDLEKLLETCPFRYKPMVK